MARTGVAEEQVAAAADALLKASERPTIERVRALLGTGSPNTLIRHLDAWWSSLGERLAAKESKLQLPDAPSKVAEAASSIWLIALEQAALLGNENLETRRKEIDSLIVAANARADQAVEEASEARVAAATSITAKEASDVRMVDLQAVLDSQAIALTNVFGERDRLVNEVLHLSTRVDALSQQIELERAQASKERGRRSAHHRAIEGRAHQEIDRARVERKESLTLAKKLERELVSTREVAAKRVAELSREARAAEALASGNGARAELLQAELERMRFEENKRVSSLGAQRDSRAAAKRTPEHRAKKARDPSGQ